LLIKAAPSNRRDSQSARNRRGLCCATSSGLTGGVARSGVWRLPELSTSSIESFSRRGFLAAAALAAVAGAAPVHAAAPTPIARVWARAEALKAHLAPHSAAIDAAFRAGGAPGWMRVRGPAYRLGETRYGLIVEILNAAPTCEADLAIQRRAARDPEMLHGPLDWARARVRLAERELQRTA